MMKEENILLSLDNVSKLYKMGETVVTALDGVSFNVERGEFLSIMGFFVYVWRSNKQQG